MILLYHVLTCLSSTFLKISKIFLALTDLVRAFLISEWRWTLCQENRWNPASTPAVPIWPRINTVMSTSPCTLTDHQRQGVVTAVSGSESVERISTAIHCVLSVWSKDDMCKPQLLTTSFPIEAIVCWCGVKVTGRLSVNLVMIKKHGRKIRTQSTNIRIALRTLRMRFKACLTLVLKLY